MNNILKERGAVAMPIVIGAVVIILIAGALYFMSSRQEEGAEVMEDAMEQYEGLKEEGGVMMKEDEAMMEEGGDVMMEEGETEGVMMEEEEGVMMEVK